MDKIRFWFGIFLCLGTIGACFAFVFIYSHTLYENDIKAWAWAFLFSILGDLLVLEVLVLLLNVFILLIIGSAPDACGICRNCCLFMTLQAARDTVR